jgi:hypothetical protein
MTLRILETSIFAVAFAAVGLTFFDCFMAADLLTTFATSL